MHLNLGSAVWTLMENVCRICAIKAMFEMVGKVLRNKILRSWQDKSVGVDSTIMELGLREGDGTKQVQRPKAGDTSRTLEVILMCWLLGAHQAKLVREL